MEINLSSEFGRKVQKRLQEEQVIWLVTTGTDGTPQPRPVWFYWDGVSFLIYSQPQTRKLEHIQHQPRVALHLDGNEVGGNIVVFTGDAQLVEKNHADGVLPAYAQKYRAGFERIGLSGDGFAKAYSETIRVYPTELRGHI